MHAGHGDGVINARNGQIVLVGIAEPCFVAQQQRLYKARRISRKRRPDRRAEPFGKQCRRQPCGSAPGLGVQRPAAACREEHAAGQIVIIAPRMLLLRRGELCRAGQEASGHDLTVGLVKVNHGRAAFSVQRQPGGDGLSVAARLRRSQRLRGNLGRFAGESCKRAQKKRLVPAAPGKSGQKAKHADRCAARIWTAQQKQQYAGCRKRGEQHTRRAVQQKQI